jgi:peptide subunit release factor 1 (eRF1)
MANTRAALVTPLHDHLDKLAAFDPTGGPVISLYLDLRPNQHGRDQFDIFVRKALAARLQGFARDSAAVASLQQDRQRIEAYLATEIDRSANGLALFSSAANNGFFEAIQLNVPIDDHALVIDSTPHLYPLARLVDRYPRYASVVLDTNRARIFVFALGQAERQSDVTNPKTRRTTMGGWSQARYQRHADNIHLLHVKEVAATLDRVVRDENIQHVVLAGDDIVVSALKAELTPALSEKLVDAVRLEQSTPTDQILAATLEVLHRKDAETDAERVDELLGAWQSNGLGTAGPDGTLAAFELGQVDELLMTAATRELQLPSPATTKGSTTTAPLAVETSPPDAAGESEQIAFAELLVKRAHQTGAAVRFIEDPALLRDVGGVGALLRFRV